MEFRPASSSDRDAIGALLREAELPADDFARHLEHFIVGLASGAIVAAAGLERYGERALVRSVVLADHLRGSGVGSRLYERLESLAGRLGVRDLYLLTTTAERFFERHGFEAIDRERAPAEIRSTEEFTRLCPTATLMVKAL